MLPARVRRHQREREGRTAACPRCTHPHVVKAGKAKGQQRWRWRGCGDQCTRTTPRGRPPWQQSLAVFLYGHGVSMNALAKMFGVWASTILTWVRRDAADHAEKPAPSGKAIVLELDEMGHFLKNSGAHAGSGRLWIVIQAASLTGSAGVVLRQP
jgi:transposase-like protein